MEQKIALIGFGTVGRGLAEILQSKRSELLKKYGYSSSIVAIIDIKYGTIYDPEGLDIQTVLDELSHQDQFRSNRMDWTAEETIRYCNADVICELAFTNLTNGEPAITHCNTAFVSGKHVVTSNKGPAALAYQKMKSNADAHNVLFMIEGTVMSGTPVLNLSYGPLAGCKINAIKGILNGTTNYILTQMESGMAYDEALLQAQKLGYAEADPTGDVEGYDARAKVTILTNVVMNIPCKIDDVECTGITKITSDDIKNANSKDARWKLIGSVELKDGKVNASVRPEMIPVSHPLAGIMGAVNAITFSTDLLGDVTIVGPGAGKIETGFSILTDLLEIHRLTEENPS
ncbi:MAG: homoserine dehydrogenase [Fidelibacterota bacterium]